MERVLFRLCRTLPLKKSASIDSFKSRLNGLFVDWDRTDPQGKPVPAGKYYARGVAIGEVKIEGVAFHLNDWIDQSGLTRVVQVIATALSNDLHSALIVDAPIRQLLIFDSKTAEAKSVPINFKAQSIKSAAPNFVLFDSSQLAVIDQAGS